MASEKKVPEHVVIIPDGNRRWARKKGWKPWKGHEVAGEEGNIRSLVKEAQSLGIGVLSVWGFSTENWKREKDEVERILDVVEKAVFTFGKEIEKEKLRFRHVGRKDRLPEKMVKELERLEKLSKGFDGMMIVLCLDYGGRDEIARAVNKAIEKGEKVDEESFKDFLDTEGIADPDLIIRTGGDTRMSGFMPYQSTYAELYFTDTLFPDFNADKLREAVDWFLDVDRRFGGG
ncbi:di-trans,poly-cis-decaprenylcistransferase [Patescibacteria group bacterium]|nr:di-trans,poly-cis-decaprenylcistransferase [Nanoarchaeota archaeon]MBU1124389.1 di-trans,poly-cis-decaprenylcistransferase [Patescibacteria group bacterium]